MSLDKTKSAIKRAWIAAVVSGTWTLIITSYVVATGDTQRLRESFDVWNLLDVVLAYALAYGIYRRSRVCAVLMLTAFVIGRVTAYIEFGLGGVTLGETWWSVGGVTLGKMRDVLIPLVFVYLFVQGVRGTFTYHREAADHRRSG